jgi:Transposase DDE domain
LVVNDRGELLNIMLTPGHTDDRTPVPKLLQQLFGKVFADKGYVSQKLAFATAYNRRHSTDHQAQTQHETAIDAPQ